MTPRDDRSAPAPEVVDALVQASFTVIAHLSRVAAENELSLTQLRVLGVLRGRAPTMAALAGHLGLERSSVSGLVDRAVRRGLVRRTPSPEDGRVVHVALTEEGQRLAARVSSEVGALIAPLTQPLTSPEQAQLGTLLARVLPV